MNISTCLSHDLESSIFELCYENNIKNLSNLLCISKHLFNSSFVSKLLVSDIKLSDYGMFGNYNKPIDVSMLYKYTNLNYLSLKNMNIIQINTFPQNITQVYLDNININTLSTLYHIKNLNILHIIKCNNIYDLSIIHGLQYLTEFKFSNSYRNNSQKIIDFSPLINCHNLKRVEIFYNFTSLTVLKNNTNLEFIHIKNKNNPYNSNTPILNLNDLSNLTKLKYLQLTQCDINNINPLSNLINLEVLYICLIDINNLNPIKYLTKLKQLRLDSMYESVRYNNLLPFTDISALSNLTKLEFIHLDLINSNSTNKLNNLNSLTSFHIDTDEFNFNILSNIYSLKDLTINANYPINQNLEFIQKFINLETLKIHHNNLGNIEFLAGLINLNFVDLSNSKIIDISSLSYLINLNIVDIHSTYVHDISPLSSLNKLTQLHTYSTRITDFSSLDHLTNLKIENNIPGYF